MSKYPNIHFGQGLRTEKFLLYKGPPPHKHGIWHNAYLGLGVFKNEYGIDYKDLLGVEHVKHIDPNIQIYSPKYFSIIKGLYFNYLMEHPIEYIKNYFLKGLMTFFVL